MDQLNFNSEHFQNRKRRKLSRFFLAAGFLLVGYVGFNNSQLEPVWVKNFTGLLFFNQNNAVETDKNYVMPDKESDRLDILILGNKCIFCCTN